ncbi:MAG: purine-nucleoside phosphorylase [Candidatus Marinimicrobia bacterium]|nr:purine-nucleoside phosphorylase [Candidatus Neomarinimicrobiota bacterium]|tara:strand:- start:1688 stop:2491 length:804 start_codon:yes stop_codon:yes gene_type:complete
MNQATAFIRSKASNVKPNIGIILGSGLGPFADQVNDRISISYDDLPGFPNAGVHGHAGKLVLGTIQGCKVAVLNGRVHYYEDGKSDAMRTPICTLKELGCETLILTNAAGSLVSEVQPGSIMLLTDHINFTGVSPLFGERDSSRFVDMVDAYDPILCQKIRDSATKKGIVLHEGIYIWFCGPSFETGAEINAAKHLGADAVGMSTVPEVILARFFGLKVAAISIITNMAAGMSKKVLSHDQTIKNANKAAIYIQELLDDFLFGYGNT